MNIFEQSHKEFLQILNESEEETFFDSDEIFTKLCQVLPELEKLIQKRLGLKCKLTASLRSDRDGDYIKIVSNDLLKNYGNNPIVRNCFSKINIDFWGGKLTEDKQIWFNPRIYYEHPNGGSNGTQFLWDSLWFIPGSQMWVEGRTII